MATFGYKGDRYVICIWAAICLAKKSSTMREEKNEYWRKTNNSAF